MFHSPLSTRTCLWLSTRGISSKQLAIRWLLVDDLGCFMRQKKQQGFVQVSLAMLPVSVMGIFCFFLWKSIVGVTKIGSEMGFGLRCEIIGAKWIESKTSGIGQVVDSYLTAHEEKQLFLFQFQDKTACFFP